MGTQRQVEQQQEGDTRAGRRGHGGMQAATRFDLTHRVGGETGGSGGGLGSGEGVEGGGSGHGRKHSRVSTMTHLLDSELEEDMAREVARQEKLADVIAIAGGDMPQLPVQVGEDKEERQQHGEVTCVWNAHSSPYHYGITFLPPRTLPGARGQGRAAAAPRSDSCNLLTPITLLSSPSPFPHPPHLQELEDKEERQVHREQEVQVKEERKRHLHREVTHIEHIRSPPSSLLALSQELEDKEERQLHREVTHMGGELRSMRRVLLDLSVERCNVERALEHVHWQVDSFDAVKAMHSTQFHLLQLMAQTEVLKDLLQMEREENEHVESFVRLALADLEASGPNSFLLEASSVDLLETLTACYINQGSGFTPLAGTGAAGMGFGGAAAGGEGGLWGSGRRSRREQVVQGGEWGIGAGEGGFGGSGEEGGEFGEGEGGGGGLWEGLPTGLPGYGDGEDEDEYEGEGERERGRHGSAHGGRHNGEASITVGSRGMGSGRRSSSSASRRVARSHSTNSPGFPGGSRDGHTDLGSGFEGEGEGSSGGGSPVAGVGGARAGLPLGVSERVRTRSLRRHRSRHSEDGFEPSRLGGSPGRYSPGHAALEHAGSGSPPMASHSPPIVPRSFTHHGVAASKLSQAGAGGTAGVGYAHARDSSHDNAFDGDEDDDGSVGSEEDEEYARLMGLGGSEMRLQDPQQQQQKQQALVRRSATAPIKSLRSGASPGLAGGSGSMHEREVRKSGSDEAEEGGEGEEGSEGANEDSTMDPMAQLPGLTPSMLCASRSPDRPRPAPRPRPPISKFASSPSSALNTAAASFIPSSAPTSSSVAGLGGDRPPAAAAAASVPAIAAGAGAGGAAGSYPSMEPIPSAIARTRSAGSDFLERGSAGAAGPVAGLLKTVRSRERSRSGSGGRGEGGGGGGSRGGSWGSAGSLGELVGEEDLEAFMDYESQGGSGSDVRRRTRAGRGGMAAGGGGGGGGGGESGSGGREWGGARERSLGDILESVVSSSEAEMADKRRDRWRRSKDKILRSKSRKSDKAGAAAGAGAAGRAGGGTTGGAGSAAGAGSGGFRGRREKAHGFGSDATFAEEFEEEGETGDGGAGGMHASKLSVASVDSLSRWNSVPAVSDDWVDSISASAPPPAAELGDQQWEVEGEGASTGIAAAAVAAAGGAAEGAAEASAGELASVESAPALFVGFQAGKDSSAADPGSNQSASASPPSAAAPAATGAATGGGGGGGGGGAAGGGEAGLPPSVTRTRSAEVARGAAAGHRSARSISDMPPRPRSVSIADDPASSYGASGAASGAGSLAVGGAAAAGGGGGGGAAAGGMKSSGLRKALAKSISQKLARNKTRTPSRNTTSSSSTPLTLELEDLRLRPCELSEEMLRSIGAIYLAHAYPALWGAGEGRRAAALLASEQKRVATDEKIEKILNPTALEVLAVSSRSSPGGKKAGGGTRTRKKSEDPWEVVAAALGSVGPGGAGGGESGAGGICLSPQPISASGSGSSQGGEAGGAGSPQYHSQQQQYQYQQPSPLSPGSNATTPSASSTAAAAAAAAAGSLVTTSPSVTSSPSSFSSLPSSSSLASVSSLPSSSYSSIRKGEAGSRSRRASGSAAVPTTPRTAWLRASLAVFQNADKGAGGGAGGGGAWGAGGGEVGGSGSEQMGELGGIAGSGAVAAGLQYPATRSNSYGSGSGFGSSGSLRSSSNGNGGATSGAGGAGGGGVGAGDAAGAAGALFSSADPSASHASTDRPSRAITRTSSTPVLHTVNPITTPAAGITPSAPNSTPPSSSPFPAAPSAPMGGGIAVGSAALAVEGFVDPYGVLEFHPCPPVGAYGAAMEVTSVPSDDKYSNVDIFSLCRYRWVGGCLLLPSPSSLQIACLAYFSLLPFLSHHSPCSLCSNLLLPLPPFCPSPPLSCSPSVPPPPAYSLMLAEQLSDLDPSYLSEDEKLAFWLNLYNALLLHSFLINGYPTTHAKRISMLTQATFIIGNLPINALEIEFAVLRAPTYRSSLAKALKSRPFAYDDPRVGWALTVGEPNVSFALCPGSFCAPALRVYSARTVHAELEEAKDNFLEVAIGMSRDDRIILPKILD
ncbi:unnamed protein product, partial [Closterium sp. Naga37s-1]